MSRILLILCTCPDADCAQRIARALVGERLAACVNRLPGLISTYRWQGRLEEEREHQLLIKTTPDRFDAVAARITELHPFDVPEIIALPVDAGLPDYLQWVIDNTPASGVDDHRS